MPTNDIFIEFIHVLDADKERQKIYADKNKFVNGLRTYFPNLFGEYEDYDLINLFKETHKSIADNIIFVTPVEEKQNKFPTIKGLHKEELPDYSLSYPEELIAGFTIRSHQIVLGLAPFLTQLLEVSAQAYGTAKTAQILQDKGMMEESLKLMKEGYNRAAQLSKIERQKEYEKASPIFKAIHDRFKELSASIEDIERKYSNGIVNNFVNGNFEEGFKTLGYQFFTNHIYTIMSAIMAFVNPMLAGMTIFATAGGTQLENYLMEKEELENFIQNLNAEDFEDPEVKKIVDKIDWLDDRALVSAFQSGLWEALTESLGTRQFIRGLSSIAGTGVKTVSPNAFKEFFKNTFKLSVNKTLKNNKVAKYIAKRLFSSEGFEEVINGVAQVYTDFLLDNPDVDKWDAFDITNTLDNYIVGYFMEKGYRVPFKATEWYSKRLEKRSLKEAQKLREEIKKVNADRLKESVSQEAKIELNIPEIFAKLSVNGKSITATPEQVLSFIKENDRQSIIEGLNQLDKSNLELFTEKLGKALEGIEFFRDKNGEILKDENGNVLSLRGKLKDEGGRYDFKKVLSAALYVSGHTDSVSSVEKGLRFTDTEGVSEFFENPEDLLPEDIVNFFSPEEIEEETISSVTEPTQEDIAKQVEEDMIASAIEATPEEVQQYMNQVFKGEGKRTKEELGLEEEGKDKKEEQVKIKKRTLVNHSGGAIGSDTYFEQKTTEIGGQTKAYSFKEHKTSSKNRVELTQEELEQANEALQKANQTLKRKIPGGYVGNLLKRNYYQVKNADKVYAVGEFLPDGKRVDGGTGWAVQMAIDSGKPVAVFDQKQGKWYEYDYNQNKFVELSDTPKLVDNFAGIGTRNLNEVGKKAIDELFKTVSKADLPRAETVTETSKEKEASPVSSKEFDVKKERERLQGRIKELIDLANKVEKETGTSTKYLKNQLANSSKKAAKLRSKTSIAALETFLKQTEKKLDKLQSKEQGKKQQEEKQVKQKEQPTKIETTTEKPKAEEKKGKSVSKQTEISPYVVFDTEKTSNLTIEDWNEIVKMNKGDEEAAVGEEVPDEVLAGTVEVEKTPTEEEIEQSFLNAIKKEAEAAFDQELADKAGMPIPEDQIDIDAIEGIEAVNVPFEIEPEETETKPKEEKNQKETKNINGDIGEDIKFQEIKSVREESSVEIVNQIVSRLKKHYPYIELKALEKVFNSYGREVAGRAFRLTAEWSTTKGTIDTAPHEVFHILLDMMETDPVVKLGIKKFGSKEALTEAVGQYYANRIQQDGMLNKVKVWLKQFWLRVKKLFGRLSQEDIVQIIGEEYYQGRFAQKVADEYLSHFEEVEERQYDEEEDDRFQEHLQEIKYDNEFEASPIVLGDKVFNTILNVFIPKTMYGDFIRIAKESYNEDFNKMVEDFIAKKIEYIHKNTKYRILIKDDEVVVKYNGIVRNRLKKERFVKAETAFVNSVANSDSVVQVANKEHNLPVVNADGRIELFAWLEGSRLNLKLKNHIAPDGKNFNTSTIRNFIQKDWMKGIISKRIVYFSTKDIYTIIKDKKGNEFAIKARRPDFSVTKEQIDAWNKGFAENFNNGYNQSLYYFIGNVDGDNSHLFFGLVPDELINMNKDQFIEYLAKEVENKLMTETDAKKNVKYAMEKFAAGNTQIFAQLAARHELFKEIKGKDYAIRYQKKGLAKFWKYFKLDNGKGIESPLPAKMMLVDHENLVVKYKGKEVPVHLSDGKYAWDGWQIVSPKWMHKVTTMLGAESAVLKSVVRYHDGQGNYIVEKMGSFTAFPGMEFYRKTDKGLELVAKVEGNDRNARIVDSQGNEIDHIVTQEEAKDFAGDFENFWEVKSLPRDAIRILFYPVESAKTSAHPVLAYELGLNTELQGNQVYKRWLNAVEKFIGERVDENIKNIVDIVNDPKKLAEFVIGDGAPTTEVELAASINPKALYLPHLQNQWEKRFINRIIDRINRLRPLEGNGTKLFFKPHVFMDLKKGEVAISGENRTVFKKIATMYSEQTEKKVNSEKTEKKVNGEQTKKKVPYNSYGIDILNAWLDRNPVYVLGTRNPIQDHTKIQLYRIRELVKGYHGETIFFSYEDVFGTHEGDFDIDSASIEFLPNYLQKYWLEWQNSPEFQKWYRDVYDIFKSKAEKGSPADPYEQDEFVENNNITRGAQGIVVNAKTVFHTLSWKNTEVEFTDGTKAVMYKPFDRVVMDYWEVDEEKLNSKFRNGKTLKQMIEESGDRIVEINGKKYLETQKTTEFSYILQMAVDDLKFRLLKELNTDNLHLWMIQRMFKYSDGSKIEKMKHLRALSKLYSLFNYSNVTYGRTKRFNVKMNASEYIDTVEDVYDRFYNGDKMLSSEEISSKITQQLRSMTSSYWSSSPVKSVKMNNKLSARELIFTQFVKNKKHSSMFYNLTWDDKKMFHESALDAVFKQFDSEINSIDKERKMELKNLIDRLSIELDKIDNERYSNPNDVEDSYHEYRMSKQYEDFMLKYADEFNSLTKEERIYTTLYWLYGAKRTEKGQRRVVVNRMMPIMFMDKAVFSAYAEAYYEAMKSSDVLDFKFSSEQKSALGKIVRIITPEFINNDKVC